MIVQGTTPAHDREVRCTVSGSAAGPVVVYLPGLHGDSTLFGGMRARLADQFRIVEVCYPRGRNDGLGGLATAVVVALAAAGIGGGTLLAESFGSQVAWAILRDAPSGFQTERICLAGGFVSHPWPWAVRMVGGSRSGAPSPFLGAMVYLFPRIAPWIGETWTGRREAIRGFVAERRRPGDRLAMCRRLRMILDEDLRSVAANTKLPVHQLTGFWDPIVPWWSVDRWLRRNCPGHRGPRRLVDTDHAVLFNRPTAAAAWLREILGNGNLPENTGFTPNRLASGSFPRSPGNEPEHVKGHR
jgi:pimeloyl-ACP methyl ester carboxylesterase